MPPPSARPVDGRPRNVVLEKRKSGDVSSLASKMVRLEKQNGELKEVIKTKDEQLSIQADKIKSMKAKFAALEQPVQENYVPDVGLIREDWLYEIATSELFDDVQV